MIPTIALFSLLSPALAADAPLADRQVGVGLGTTLTELDSGWPSLDTYSLRFQLTPRVALEPELTIQATGASQDEDVAARELDLSLGAGARWYAASGPTTHLVGLVGARAGRSLALTETEARTDETRTVSTSALVGLGIEWAPYSAFSVSLDARHPLFSWASARYETDGELVSEYGQWSTGLRLQPQVSLMAHLYY